MHRYCPLNVDSWAIQLSIFAAVVSACSFVFQRKSSSPVLRPSLLLPIPSCSTPMVRFVLTSAIRLSMPKSLQIGSLMTPAWLASPVGSPLPAAPTVAPTPAAAAPSPAPDMVALLRNYILVERAVDPERGMHIWNHIVFVFRIDRHKVWGEGDLFEG